MNCEKVNELLNEFHDGAASVAVKTRMEKHIADCPSCGGALNRLQALRNLLQTDVAPVPSASLDRNLMRAFLEKHHSPAKPPTWWDRLFAGSVNIPKPAFAAALVAVALAVTAANLIGRNAADFSVVNTTSTASVVSSESLPKVIETTKIVEVPVIKERVVTKTIYVERESADVQRTAKKSLDFNLIQTNAINKKRDNRANSVAGNLPMSGSVAENGYFTRTDLSDFEPASDSKIRIIKKEKTDEK